MTIHKNSKQVTKKKKIKTKPIYSSNITDVHHSPSDAQIIGNLKGKTIKNTSQQFDTQNAST